MGIMKEFEDPTKGKVVYASTNKYMSFAIDFMDEAYTPIINDHASVALWYNALLPIELKELRYEPAEWLMRHWASIFFSNVSKKGLIPTLALMSGRRYFQPNEIDPATGQQGYWKRLSGDTRSYSVLEGMYASVAEKIDRMHIFLTWFSNDPSILSDLLTKCVNWANAFMQMQSKDNWYGHRIAENDWKLYNFVHTGPPLDIATNDPTDWDMRFRFAFEGFPDAGLVIAEAYGNIAHSFVLLSRISGDSKYSNFADFINEGLWNSRFNHENYLMPNVITPWGPLPGDQDPGPKNAVDQNQDQMHQFKYNYDTDCLYWARAIFRTYTIFDKIRTDLCPLETEDAQCGNTNDLTALKCRIKIRKNKLLPLFTGTSDDKYLAMALGLTLDWIGYGWNPSWRHFIRKIHHDGTPGSNTLYGDAKFNTLYILIDAYKFTHDKFYLTIFELAWQKFEELTQGSTFDFFPERVDSGNLVPQPDLKCDETPQPTVECDQGVFLDIIVSAYLATVSAGQPMQSFLLKAELLADKIINYRSQGIRFYGLQDGLIDQSCIRLALARNTLRRISLHFSEENLIINILQGNSLMIELSVPGSWAIVYMDDGQYRVTKRRSDGTILPSHHLSVTADAEVAL